MSEDLDLGMKCLMSGKLTEETWRKEVIKISAREREETFVHYQDSAREFFCAYKVCKGLRASISRPSDIFAVKFLCISRLTYITLEYRFAKFLKSSLM